MCTGRPRRGSSEGPPAPVARSVAPPSDRSSRRRSRAPSGLPRAGPAADVLCCRGHSTHSIVTRYGSMPSEPTELPSPLEGGRERGRDRPGAGRGRRRGLHARPAAAAAGRRRAPSGRSTSLTCASLHRKPGRAAVGSRPAGTTDQSQRSRSSSSGFQSAPGARVVKHSSVRQIDGQRSCFHPRSLLVLPNTLYSSSLTTRSRQGVRASERMRNYDRVPQKEPSWNGSATRRAWSRSGDSAARTTWPGP
jgi:hypothetical protein